MTQDECRRIAREVALKLEFPLREVPLHQRYEMADAIADALYAQMPQWQPIDTAPKDGTMVLLYPSSNWVEGTKGDYEVSYFDADLSAWMQSAYPDDFDGFTHWQPLPSPPETIP